MLDKGGELVMSNGKRPRVKLAVVVTSTLLVVISAPFPVAASIPSCIRYVQPAAEFVFTVVAPNVWSWITPSCLYLLLNLLILALGLQSGALAAFNSDYTQTRPSTNFIKPAADGDGDGEDGVEQTHEFDIQSHADGTSISKASVISGGCERVRKARNEDEESSSMKEGGLYGKKSRCTLLRRSTAGLSNLSREATHTQLTPHVESMRASVVFEICADEGEADDLDQEEHTVPRHEGSLSSEELYAKAESFIGNFYRELKIQRENSWNRLCAIYRQTS